MNKRGYDLETFRGFVKGTFLQKGSDKRVYHILTDSRTVDNRSGMVFFAIKGIRKNGHDYIAELYGKGVRIFVISEEIDLKDFPNATIISVTNGLSAFQDFAAAHRARFHIPIIAVTGSNGKTMVKEWIFQALQDDFHIARSPKSYNSQVGVPISVLSLDENHQLAVFEAGISKPGEMVWLEKIIKPTIGIFTNIGAAHQENFLSVSEKIDEKLELFTSVDTLIYCRDHEELHARIAKAPVLKNKKLLTWSNGSDADLQLTKVIKEGIDTRIEAVFGGKPKQIVLPFSLPAYIENACQVWLLMLHLHLDDASIADRLSKLAPVAMRLEQLEGVHGSVLINDSYNSDLNSLEIALDFLKSHSRRNGYTAIVSDILQSGKETDELYRKVAALIRAKGIDRFIGIGKAMVANQSEFKGAQAAFYDSTEAYLAAIDKRDFIRENILLKGARPFRFERIADILQEKTHETVLEIDLNRMRDNLNFFKSLLHPETRIMAMVKAFAYGSGSYDVARLLAHEKVDYLAVAYTDEGISLRENGIDLPIMVLNPELGALGSLIRYRLEPQIYSLNLLDHFLEVLLDYPDSLPYPIHIKLNTGMNRLGFDKGDTDTLIARLVKTDLVELKAVFTHLAASDDPDSDEATEAQMADFKAMTYLIQKAIGKPFMRHILNSSGIIRHAAHQMDMVRLGLGLYGLTSAPAFQQKLKPVSRLISSISQIRAVKAGAGIGYNPSRKLEKDKLIAVIPIGYADGLPRTLGNGLGSIYINGQQAPIMGNVCMDMTMVDVTNIPCAEGDAVEVFGDNMSIYEVATKLKTIPYEVLTNISQRVKRVFIQE